MIEWNGGFLGIKFLSTLSVRRATSSIFICVSVAPISIHALREESDAAIDTWPVNSQISIHALREESDCSVHGGYWAIGYFYPRSP